MPRIALVCSEPIRPVMAGVGIRYVEMARQLCASGLDVCLYAPDMDMSTAGLPAGGRASACTPETFLQFDAAFDAVVVQGHLADRVLQSVRTTPLVLDLYDPSLLENMSCAEVRGTGIYRSGLALLRQGCRRADFFLCATETQRSFYLGILTALDRVPPSRLASDRDARRLIDVVPFGVPDPVPPHRSVLPAADPGTKRLLFGGLYDWYDPGTALEALKLPGLGDCRLLFMKNPNPDTTPQALMKHIHAWRRANPEHAARVEFLDWVPWDRRFDLLRDVDLLVAPHLGNLESRFSMRTRYLEAIAAGCPVVATEGGEAADLVSEFEAGFVVPGGDPAALATAIDGLLQSGKPPSGDTGKRFAELFNWHRVLEPLTRFCRAPSVDRFKPADGDAPDQPHASRSPAKRGLPAFSVVIPTFNRLDTLPSVLDALGGQYEPPEFEVIVVDDGSTDGSTDWLKNQAFRFPARLVRQENRGPAAARNAGVQAAQNPYIAFLGDDIIVDRFWLRSHAMKHAEREFDGEMVVVGYTDWHPDVRRSAFLEFLDRTGWQFGYDRIRNVDDVPFNFLYGSNLSLGRDCALREPFHEGFPYPAWEDIELGYRLKGRGARIAYEPAARGAHLHQPSIMRIAARHRKTGSAAVEFCRLHPELETFLWPSEGPSAASGPLVRVLRKLFAATLEHLPVDLTGTWDRILRDHYAAGITDYMKRHGLEDLPAFRNWRIFPITYHANSPLLGHHTGRSSGSSWVCVPRRDDPGHCVFGPGFTVQDEGAYEARYYLHNGSGATGPGRWVTLDVYDQGTDRTLAAAPIGRRDMLFSPGCVTLPFSGRTGQRLEFRVFWHGSCRLDIDRIELRRAATS